MDFKKGCRKGDGRMIDLDDVASLVRMYYRVVIGVVIIIALIAVLWIFRDYGGREEVKQTIDAIRTTTETNKRRADAIIDAAKAKESEVTRDVAKKVSSASSDDLPDLFAGLLADYRAQH